MYRQIMGWIVVLVLTTGISHAATLEIPTPHTTVSGIGVISGWKCDAGELTVRFNGGDPLPLVYGSERKDVLDAGACDHAEVGFVSIMNWGELGDGLHTAVVYDDDMEFDRSTFDVVTTGETFLRGAAGQCVVEDFPAPNENARFIWNQPTQHMELAEVGGAELLPVQECPAVECPVTECPTCQQCEVYQECPAPPQNNLARYNGTWQMRLRYTFPGCTHNPDASFTFRMLNGTASGSTYESSFLWSISGAVAPSGTFAATASADGQPVIAWSGTLGGWSGSGRWFNALGCGVLWTATKR